MRKLFIIFFLLSSIISFATHNRAGEITYTRIGSLTYRVKITTYTYTPSLADRCNLDIRWGDGSSSIVQRTNGPQGQNPNGQFCEHLGEELSGEDQIKKNEYIAIHTYTSPGTYIISVEDPNRNAGVVNIPGSVNVPFYIESVLVINPFLGEVNSPVLLNPPIDKACVNKPFVHNPGAYSPDGDSLSYQLIINKGLGGKNVPGYSFPQATKGFSLDAMTGELIWDSPIIQGEYNIAILVSAWRHGVLVSSVIRDMQITVGTCNNNPPEIITIDDTCVVAGDTLRFNVLATDPDGNFLRLRATGGAFSAFPDSAFFPLVSGNGSAEGEFVWSTSCENIRKFPWDIIFRAEDTGQPIRLVDIKSVRITVIPPAIKNLSASTLGNNAILNWNKTECLNAIGYNIYRSNECPDLIPQACKTGLEPGSGFTLIGTTESPFDTTFTDNNSGKGLTHGITYGYVVTAYYENNSESIISNVACISLIRDIPIITNVSITGTDIISGTDFVAWAKPKELDSIKFPGPYKYLLYRGINNDNLILIDSLEDLNDTTYNDINLNTLENQYYYKVELVSNGNQRILVGSTTTAASVYLNIAATDNTLNLSWDVDVPWINEAYVVYRRRGTTGNYDSLTTVTSTSYSDTGLKNGEQYCYYIKSNGKYTDPDFNIRVINLSQEMCGIPVDNKIPCPPILDVKIDCREERNILVWTNPNNSCSDGTDDVLKFYLYYSREDNDEFQLLDTIFIPDTSITLNTFTGCYKIVAVDSTGNQSSFDSQICVDLDSENECVRIIKSEGNENICIREDINNYECKFFKLPDIFSPDNGDNFNNFFIPFNNDFVRSIDLKIYNRWGKLVFETNNPEINWDGKEMTSHKECPAGVYFYVCIVYEERLSGLQSRTLKGTVTIVK